MAYRYVSNQAATGSLLRLFFILFLGLCTTPVWAQQSWREATDSSNRYFAQGKYEQSFLFGLKMLEAAKPLHERNRDDTTLVASLVTLSISQRLAHKPDTAIGHMYATQALSLMTPELSRTFLGAKVYSLNAIFNYMAGKSIAALQYAETAATISEKLGRTNNSPYWEVQRYRILIYLSRKDSISHNSAMTLLTNLLPISARTFGKNARQYTDLLALWANKYQLSATATNEQRMESDSLWKTVTDVLQQHPSNFSNAETIRILDKAATYNWSANHWEQACDYARRMLTKAEELHKNDPENDTTLIQSLHTLATYRFQLSPSYTNESIKYIDRAMDLFPKGKSSVDWQARVYALSGQLHKASGDRVNALAHSKKAIDLLEKSGRTETADYINAQMTVASLHALTRDRNDLAVAQRILESLVSVAEKTAGVKGRMKVLSMLGTAYLMSVPLDDSTQRKSDKLWHTLPVLAVALGDSVQICRLWNGLGEYYIASNEPDSARIALEESIRVGRRLSNPVYMRIAQVNLSTVETVTGHYQQAARLADEVLATPEIQSLPEMLLLLMANATDGNLQIGRVERAETLARQAMKLAEEQYGTRINYIYALSLGALGRVYYNHSDFSTALFYLEESIRLLEQTARPSDPVLARVQNMVGDMYMNIDPQKALVHHRKSLEAMARQPNHQQSASYLYVLQSMMVTQRKLRHLPESVQIADSVIRVYGQPGADKLYVLPSFLEEAFYTYVNAGRRATADSIVEQLKRILLKDTLSETIRANVLHTIGIANQLRENYQEAIANFSACIDLGQKIHGSSSNIDAYVPVRLAFCHLNLGHRAEAVRMLRESLERLHANISQNLWYMDENQRETYIAPYLLTEIYGVAFQNQTPVSEEIELAYDYRLLMQGVLFNTSRKVLQIAVNQPNSRLRDAVQKLLNLRKTIAQASFRNDRRADLDSLKEESTRLEKQVGYFAGTIQQETRAYSWRDVRKRLKPGQAAVELIRYNQWQLSRNPHETDTVHYVALIVRPEWETPRLVRLSEGNAMESNWLADYRQAIEQPEPSGAAYRRFWAPIAGQLKGVQTVFVAADGIYHSISLPTLYNSDRQTYLADEIQIVVVGSTRELVNRQDRSFPSSSALFGFPDYHTQHNQTDPVKTRIKEPTSRTRGDLVLADLPATEREVRSIARLLATLRITPTVRIGKDASESVLKSTVSPRILHIATHGFFKPDTLNKFYTVNRLLACGLALAGAADTTNRLAGEEDGVLTGYEASLLNLNKTELVTLSACETGVGDLLTSEGVFGVQRAFLLAGVQSVLMSLWKVNDQLTQQLMTDFYRYWMAGLKKPQALRKAQLNLRKTYPEPYYWGAFVLIGQ